MKSINIIATVVLLCVLLYSCDIQDFDNPDNELPEISIQDQLKGTIIQAAYNQVAIPERVSNVLMQYLEEYDFSVVGLESYDLRESYFNNYWSNGMYNGSLKSGNELLIRAREEGFENMEAVAKILLALEYGNLASAFGDIPYSQALLAEEGIIKPIYDTQEEVYTSIILLLTEAIEMLPSSTDNQIQNGDVFAGGDLQKWKYLANGLLARYYLHLSSRDPSNYNKALERINLSYPNLDDQIIFTFNESADIEHPLHTFSYERPATYFANTAFLSTLESKNDPRISSYFNDDNGFGNESGFENRFWSRIRAFVPIVSYVELQFIKAEAQLMTGISDETVSTTLANAIRASMQQVNIDGEEYITANSDLSVYITQEEKLEHLINEAYYSYYGYGAQQSWNNYRRLGYPKLTLTGSPSATNPSAVIPKRYLYPTNALEYNSMNTQIAKDNQQGALLDNAVWLYQ